MIFISKKNLDEYIKSQITPLKEEIEELRKKIIPQPYIAPIYPLENCQICGKKLEWPNNKYRVNGKPACLSCCCDDMM
jgi:hypothetical protein